MGRILFFVLFFMFIGYVLMFGVSYKGNLALGIATQNAPLLEAIKSGPTDFSETGTLVFYPNNIVPVPYLFYQNKEGRTASKALVFPSTSPENFSSWSGAHISVTGSLVAEHVVVSSLVYMSAP